VRDAIIGEWVAHPNTVNWAGHPVTANVVAMGRRPLPPADQVTRRRAIFALPTIGRLAREGVIQLVTYEELNTEYVSGRNPVSGTRGDLLAGVTIVEIPTAVSRSHFHQVQREWDKQALTDFCQKLLKLNATDASRYALNRRNLPASTVESIKDLKRFQDLCRGAPDKMFSDLFHIWTGERGRCDYFLTMETRVCNWVGKSCKVKPLCMPIRPDDLVARLGVTTLDAMPFAENEFLDAVDARNVD